MFFLKGTQLHTSTHVQQFDFWIVVLGDCFSNGFQAILFVMRVVSVYFVFFEDSKQEYKPLISQQPLMEMKLAPIRHASPLLICLL